MTAPCQAANPLVSRPEFTRVYASNRAQKAHLVRHSGEPNALCGRYADWWGFLGTGSQLEYEHAAILPTCADCQRKATA